MALLPLISAFGIPAEFILPVSPLPVTGKAININNKPQKHSIMKTSNYLIGLAALTSFTLVGCSDNDFIGSASNIFSSGKEEITFGSGTKNLTRAGEIQHAKAAEKLNNHFVLYGFKYNPTELAALTNDELVFDHYNLYYQEGTENTTESNTAGWEYVGYQNQDDADQSIKYWDHSAVGYVFSAISSIDATAEKIAGATTTKYDKGWDITIPAGGTLNSLYASDRVEKKLSTTSGSDYDKEVMLTFYSIVTKVRFAFYEIIPGYKVHIDKFYYGSSAETATNFAIDGDFRGLKTDGDTKLKVTYYDDDPNDDGIENRPKLTYVDTGTGAGVSSETSKVFGTNIQATAAIGTSSPEATYDQAGGEYTCILPYKSGKLSLKVDYTLTSIDGSKETIVVKGATAVVPDIYTNWKENFAYTYLFKISDNSNGYTGTDGVRGLYPITFDACVVNEEDGIQETITSIAEPSITTYQNGVIVTENDEYIEGKTADNNTNIYYTVMLNGVAQALNANTQVYEVNNYGTETLTENVVENWKNNYCVLTAVTSTKATEIPMKNGAKLSPTGETAYYFTPKKGKNYVIQYHVDIPVPYKDAAEYNSMTGQSVTTVPAGEYKINAGYYYKLIRVVGDPTAPTYTLTAAASQKITTQAGTVIYTLQSNSPAATTNVLGAADIFQIKNASDEDVTAKFDITDNENGTYTIKATNEAIKEGLDAAAYTVAVVKKDGTVGTGATLDDANNTFAVDMTISANTANVVAKNRTTVTPLIGGAIVEGAEIVNTIPGLTVKESTTAGTYDVIADNTIAVGDHTITIAGETVTITAKSYKFTTDDSTPVDLPSKTLTWAEGAAAPSFLAYLYDGTANVTPLATTTNTEAKIVKPDSGEKYTVTATAGGKTQFTYENATLDVTVNQYALTCEGAAADAKEIEDLTGSAKLIFTLNNVAQVVKSGKIKVYYCSTKDGAYASATGKTYSLVNNGKYFTFGNVVTTGYYKFEYLADDNTTVLGSEIIWVK